MFQRGGLEDSSLKVKREDPICCSATSYGGVFRLWRICDVSVMKLGPALVYLVAPCFVEDRRGKYSNGMTAG